MFSSRGQQRKHVASSRQPLGILQDAREQGSDLGPIDNSQVSKELSWTATYLLGLLHTFPFSGINPSAVSIGHLELVRCYICRDEILLHLTNTEPILHFGGIRFKRGNKKKQPKTIVVILKHLPIKPEVLQVKLSLQCSAVDVQSALTTCCTDVKPFPAMRSRNR
jgi:hypothetical protein